DRLHCAVVTKKKTAPVDVVDPTVSRAENGKPSGTGQPEGANEVELLVSATLAVAARRGTIEPSVREILEQAGLSTKAFYRHFRSKDELLLVTLEEGSRVLVEYLEHQMSTFSDPLDKVGAWINGVVRQAVNPSAARRTLPWTLGASRLATVFPEQFDKNQARIIAPLHREIANSVKDDSGQSPDPARDARLIYGYTLDTVRYNLIKDTVPSTRTLRHLVEFAHRALGAKPKD
ncbi:MAG TPA: TetR/AcrR family transcriptional regulator, partial [Acidimicrobiales bacterium]